MGGCSMLPACMLSTRALLHPDPPQSAAAATPATPAPTPPSLQHPNIHWSKFWTLGWIQIRLSMATGVPGSMLTGWFCRTRVVGGNRPVSREGPGTGQTIHTRTHQCPSLHTHSLPLSHSHTQIQTYIGASWKCTPTHLSIHPRAIHALSDLQSYPVPKSSNNTTAVAWANYTHFRPHAEPTPISASAPGHPPDQSLTHRAPTSEWPY